MDSSIGWPIFPLDLRFYRPSAILHLTIPTGAQGVQQARQRLLFLAFCLQSARRRLSPALYCERSQVKRIWASAERISCLATQNVHRISIDLKHLRRGKPKQGKERKAQMPWPYCRQPFSHPSLDGGRQSTVLRYRCARWMPPNCGGGPLFASEAASPARGRCQFRG